MSNVNSVRQRLQKSEGDKKYKLVARALPNGKVQNFDNATSIAHGSERNADPEMAFKVMALAEKDFQKDNSLTQALSAEKMSSMSR